MAHVRIALANVRFPADRDESITLVTGAVAEAAAAGDHRPSTFGEQANTFHEKAALCRAAENTCYFATVNYASDGSPTTSAVVSPDGTVLTSQPYGKEGLLVADLDLDAATGLLARRLR